MLGVEGKQSEDNDGLRTPTAVIDPLSEVILKRANTSEALNSLVPLTGSQQTPRRNINENSPSQDVSSPSLRHSDTRHSHDQSTTLDSLKRSHSTTQNPDKRGFFSKLLQRSSGRPTDQDEADVSWDRREEGWNADVFGFVPNFPVPPKYIHVRAHRKAKREFTRLFVAQELKFYPAVRDGPDNNSRTSLLSEKTGNNHSKLKREGSRGAIWSMKFSEDGRYLATGGEDTVIRIWQVISHPGELCGEKSYRDSYWSDDEDDINGVGTGSFSRKTRKRAHAPVFKCKPIHELVGHTSDVLDVSWSKNNFLLSSSMDKTVRLWHVDRSDCLCTFLHSDFVTSIVFHPKDDRFFLSGSLDCKLRLWSIPDKEVAYIRDVPDLITAVAFSPSGQIAIAGCFGGQCIFFDTEGLKFRNQMHVRSSRGRNSRGSKITGIETYQLRDPSKYQGFLDRDVKLLISTNDSRIRIYNLHDRSLDLKFKGHENEQSQIHATISDNLAYIISGSEDNRTYIWRVSDTRDYPGRKERQDYEYFHSNKATVTVAVFAPTLTKRILAETHDPIYDICDPPPVKLRSPDENGEEVEQKYDESGFPVLRPENSKASHPNGNIIVTADHDGTIKVFRQDCAYEPRKVMSEAASNMQRKRLSNMGLSPQHSWRDSLSMARSRSLRSASFRAASPRPPPLPFDRSHNILSEGSRSRNASMDSRRSRKHLDSVVSPQMSFSSLNSSRPIQHRDSSIVASDYVADSADRPPLPHHISDSAMGVQRNNVMKCANCNDTSFNASKIDNDVRLICSK